MKKFNLFALLILSFGLLAHSTSAKVKQQDFKVLAQGNQSTIEKPFIFAARSAQTYAQLKEVVTDLPDASTIDFEKFAVLAGFAGTRSTGGFSVEIKNGKNQFSVTVNKPGKDMMVTQMITTPYKVVLIPIDEDKGLTFNYSTEFSSRMETYRISKGNFEFSGGIAGRKKNFTADGTVKVLTYGDLVTFTFDLTGKGIERKRKLIETASGTMTAGKTSLARLDAGSFSDNPHPPFSVTGNLNKSKLTLTFAPLPTSVNDGYSGRGNLEALKIR